MEAVESMIASGQEAKTEILAKDIEVATAC
jgi:hypothetical protein